MECIGIIITYHDIGVHLSYPGKQIWDDKLEKFWARSNSSTPKVLTSLNHLPTAILYQIVILSLCLNNKDRNIPFFKLYVL